MMIGNRRLWDVITIFFVLGLSYSVFGQDDEPKGKCEQTSACDERQSSDHLTGDWWGARTKLEDAGIDFSLSFNSVYQDNMHGGADTKDAQRITGKYDLELTLDLERLLRLKGASLYVQGEGGFGNGLDGAGKIGDIFGVNDNMVGYRSVDVLQLWYQQNLFDDKLQIRVGKIDLFGTFECRGCPVSFDGNSYANDGTTQFLNSALCNNPTIPAPDQGLGAIIHYNPIEWFYTSIGASDAQSDARTTGFHSTFHEEDYFFYMYEFGFVPHIKTKKGPLPGAYRFGLWYDPQPKEKVLSRNRPEYKRDDMGFYTSFNQMVYREDDKSDQGLGFFFRYGFAPSDVNQIEHFWSVGGQYQGLIPRRDDDVLGFGVAQGLLTHDLGYQRGVSPGRETVLELYYNIQITKWLSISPDIQVILDPGAQHQGRDATIIGLRLQMSL